MLTQQQIQLPGVVLHVAHVVQNQLEDAEVSAEILESGLGFFVGQTENGGSGFFTTMLEVGLYFGFAVNAIWHHARRIKLVKGKWRRWCESCWRFREPKIQPEQRVIHQVPKLRFSGLIVPNFFRAIVHRVLEHFDGRAKLLPKDLSESLVHIRVYAAIARSRVIVGASFVRFAAFFNFS
jgi:hypothetical protein